MKKILQKDQGIIGLWLSALSVFAVLAFIPNFPFLFHGADKLFHIGAFMFLACLPARHFLKVENIIISILGLIACGMLIEFTQSFIPGRDASLLDMAANMTGIMAGLSAGILQRARLRAWAHQSS